MSASFEFAEVDHFCTGAIGEPGSRTFFLQVGADGALVSVKVEKQQVAALAEYLARILEDLAPVDGPPTEPATARQPVVAEWPVGTIGVALDDTGDRVVLMVEEMTDPEEPDAEAAVLRAGLSLGQVRSFIEQGRDLVAQGRPLCQLCGGPEDPDGHVCPRLN